ncbi:MAG TPA: proprotein convertase P-domain-containing protein, partial [Gemmatales bacterium]|nr:proprotein convertase P-domain-containing protein [Gemmatales bacterium]
AQGLTFENNTINGAFIFVPADFFTGFLQQLYVNTILDDVGVPYVLTQRFVIGGPLTTPGLPGQVTLTFDPGTILKLQNTSLDGIDFGEPNDRTFGTIRVNGTVNRPVLFTSLTDDNVVANTDLAALYNNGSLDTNNDGAASTPVPGDWAGIRIAQGNIDHAVVRFGGGVAQVNGTFVNSPAIRVFARDLTPAGGAIQQVRIANTEVTQTFSINDPSDPLGLIDSPAIDLFSRDDGDTRFAGPFSPIVRTGDVQVMDNNIHDNQGKAVKAHPLYFHDRRNSLGGYGVYMARNIIENNASNGVFVQFILDQNRAIDQNLPSAGGVFDDSDIVHVIDGQMLIVHPDQFFQIMSQRGVVPDQSSGGYLQKFTDLNTFLSNLKLRLPGNLPTDVTKPLELPLQQGPLSVNPNLVDSGLFYYLTNFDTTSRNAANAIGTTLRGEEWRDWGVNFVYNGETSNLVDTLGLFPFQVTADPNNPTGRIFTTNTNNADGSFEMVFPDQVSAVGFYINNNQVTSPNEKIELFDATGRLIDSAPLPTTGVNGRTYFARISKTPIYRVRITEDAGDNSAASSVFTNNTTTAIPDNGAAVEIPITVGANFNIADLNVGVNIVHARAADLQIDLVAPDGTIVPLAKFGSATATGANYTNTYFDDSAVINADVGIAPFSGAYQPTSFNAFSATPTGLGVLNGLGSAGTWKLRVRDGKAGNAGSVTNFTLNFKSNSLAFDKVGISGLAWVQAPASMVVKANTVNTEITAGGVLNGYAGITQNAAGVITNGFVPQMATNTTGVGASGMFTFGQSTTSTFTRTGPVTLSNGGSTLIDLNVTNDLIPYDLTLNLNMIYSGNNSELRVRLRAPDGTEINLVNTGSAQGAGGFTNTTFDDQTQLSQTEIANLNGQTVQSASFSQTRATNPSQQTPFGMTFYRGKNVRGTWVLVIDKQDGQTGTFTNATISFRGMTGGWGSTLRILGQGNAPVILTGIQDDSAGAGP